MFCVQILIITIIITYIFLLLSVQTVGVTVKQVVKQFLHDFVIWFEIIKTNGFIVCNNYVLPFTSVAAFFSASEKSEVCDSGTGCSWHLGHPSYIQNKNHQHGWYPQGNYHDALGNIEIILSWLGINFLLVFLGIKLFLFSSPELLPKSFCSHPNHASIWMNGSKTNA